jgi:adenine nucleotide transporter 17
LHGTETYFLQYTAFEQMKNLLVARRTSKLRAAGIASAVAVLTDWDTFLLAALAKLSGCYFLFCGLPSSNEPGSRHVLDLSIYVGFF